jgi:hypothetical protein
VRVQGFDPVTTWGNMRGGVIISDQHVLTVGHIIVGTDIYIVWLGSNSRNQQTPINVTSAIQQPDFGFRRHDIAIMTIPRITFTSSIQPATLVSRLAFNVPSANDQGLVLGFGQSGTNRPTPDDLEGAYMKVTTDARCQEAFWPNMAENFCAEDLMNGGDFCLEDEGNGFRTTGNIITGLALNGACGSGTIHGTQPSIFLRLSFYRQWSFEETGV